MKYIRCNRELHLDVGVDLDISGIPIELRWTLIARWADGAERATIHVDVHKRRRVMFAIEVLRPRQDVGVLVGGELEYCKVDAVPLGLGPQFVGRAIDRVGL